MSKLRSEFPQTPINLTLREEQISTILYCLEGYAQGNDDDELVEELDEIFEVLESTVDKFYAKIEKAKAKQPTMEWD
jgi:predicted HAD superfamily phosphohydrolase